MIKMVFDEELFQSNIEGIAELEINQEDLVKLILALRESKEFHLAALLSFSSSLNLQLRDLEDNYNIILTKGENNG